MAKKSTGKRAELNLKRITELRKDLPNAYLSKRTKGVISEPQMSKLLSGSIKNPRIDTLCALTHALGLSLREMDELILFK